MRHFEFSDGKSDKFWEIERAGESFTVRWGRRGTAGQSQTKSFASEAAAVTEHDKLIAEKLKKGYTESAAAGGNGQSAAPSAPPAPDAALTAARSAIASVRSSLAAKSAAPSSAPAPPPAASPPAAAAPPPAAAASSPAAAASSPTAAASPPAAAASPLAAAASPSAPAPSSPAGTHAHAGAAVLERPATSGGLLAPIQWPDALRRKVHPRRGGAPTFKADRAKAFGKLVAAHQKWRHEWTPNAEHGAAEFRAAVEAMAARLESGVDTPSLDVAEAAAMGAWLWINEENCQVLEPLIEYWVAVGGPAFALEALVSAARMTRVNGDRKGKVYGILGNMHKDIHSWFTVNEIKDTCKIPALRDAWELLRRCLAGAPEAAYEAALSAAERWWQEVGPPLRCMFAFAFPARAEWAEQCLEAAQTDPCAQSRWSATAFPYHAICLLGSLTRAEQFADICKHYEQSYRYDFLADYAPTMVDGAALEALPSLCWMMEKTTQSEVRRLLAACMAVMVCDEVAARLAPLVDDKDKIVRATAADYFKAAPDLAMRHFGPRLAARGKSGQSAESLLRQVLTLHPNALASNLATLDAASAAAIQALQARAAAEIPAETIDVSELPPLFVRPPWVSKTPRKAPKVVKGLVVREHPEHCVWARGERESLLEWVARDRERMSGERTDAQLVAAWFDICLDNPNDSQFPSRLVCLRDDNLALRVWNTYPSRIWNPYSLRGWNETARILAAYEARAVPGFIAIRSVAPIVSFQALAHCASARVAPVMADALLNLKKFVPTARQWLTDFPEHAAVGLIPDAVGPSGKARDAAECAVRFLASRGERDTLRRVAAEYGAEAAAALDEVLDFDPLLTLPSRIPVVPAWADASLLPPLVTREGGKGLPTESIAHVLTMLAFSPVEPPYAGLAAVRELCDPASIDAFTWGLFEAWQGAGGPAKEQWAFLALGHLGGDEVARRLTPLLRSWPGEGLSQRAATALDVLCMIGSDVALMHLHGVAQKIRFKALQDKAREKIDKIAEARGLTVDELADRLVPDFDLDESGSRLLDFGPRAFRVGFDHRLEPFVLDGDGKRQKDLPKAAKSDDAALADEATRIWKALKKDVKTVAAAQVLRLELAMCNQRRWEVDTFKAFFVGHPLVAHLARRLVWGVFDADDRLQSTFRVAEDGSFADSDDRPFELPASARVGIPHPLEMEEAGRKKWQRVLGDYGVIQPFDQLTRPTYAIRDDEKKARTSKRFHGMVVPPARILLLEGRGWRRGDVESANFSSMTRALPAGGEAELGFSDGIYVEDLAQNGPQHLDDLTLSADNFGALSPIVFSELVADVMRLAE